MPTSFQNPDGAVLLEVVLVVGRGVGDGEVVGRVVVGVLEDGDLLLRRGERGRVHLRGVDHVVDRVDDVVPALGDRLDELAPQPRALPPDERQRALVQQAEAGRGVQHLGDDVQLADVGDRAHHVDDLGQLADRPGVDVLGGDLRHRRRCRSAGSPPASARRRSGRAPATTPGGRSGRARARCGRTPRAAPRSGKAKSASSSPRKASHSSPSSRHFGAHSVTRSPSVRESWIGTMSLATSGE